MRTNHLAARRRLPAVAALLLLAASAAAQESLLVVCPAQGACTYERVHAATVRGKDSVKTVALSAAKDPRLLSKGKSTRVTALTALVRDPRSGLVRARTPAWEPADLVLPSKLPPGAVTAAAAMAGVTIEYQKQAKVKARLAVAIEDFVALVNGPRLEDSAIEFIKREVQAGEAHPRLGELVAGAIGFSAASPVLQTWRESLRTIMRGSLDRFRREADDPTRLESGLEEGLAAMRAYRLVALDGQREEGLQEELTTEHRRFLQRCAIATAFKNAGMHDAFLEVLAQIGLARWSRPDLVNGVERALQASAALHLERARELRGAKRYDRAFDEARLASSRAPCDETIGNFYYESRVEFVNRIAIPASPEYEKEDRNILQQIVREIQGVGQDALTPERVAYVRKRIDEGLARDSGYLPLQLRKAEFLANVGELINARDVVTRIEREVPLGRAAAEEWLSLDAKINRELMALRERIGKLVDEELRNERYKEALDAAEIGLRAEPENRKLLYVAAVAAAVQRDQARARGYIQRHLRSGNLGCGGTNGGEQSLLELYRIETDAASQTQADGRMPNWVSGEPYAPGEAFYDPLSGSFHPRMVVSLVDRGPAGTSTEFHWDGYLATSITTNVGSRQGEPARRDRTVLAIEPVYDQKRVYMKGVATAANSAGERRVTPLRYLNCPDFDPRIAAKLTGKLSGRGWAGNPFFHPFLWDGIFLFDLTYDEWGRIRTATPVPGGPSQRTSPFSEPLTFEWEGQTKRLRAIHGPTYHREMVYDDRGRLTGERVQHARGEGKIEYRYQGQSMQPSQAVCEDDFYDKAHRIISIEGRDR
jgi:hypothetical protein